MTTREKIVNKAMSDIGKHRSAVGCAGSHDWCANYVSETLKAVGLDVYDWFCTFLWRKMKNSSDWDEPSTEPQPGDIIFFDWDHAIEERPLDHVAIIVGYSNGVITYVDGNGGGSQYIQKHTIGVNNSCVAYWMRYIGDDKNVTPTPVAKPEVTPTPVPAKKYCSVELEQLSKGSKSPSVETLQNLLNDLGYGIEVDKNFGSETESAVKKFQKSVGLVDDGIVGSKSWKALIEAE